MSEEDIGAAPDDGGGDGGGDAGGGDGPAYTYSPDGEGSAVDLYNHPADGTDSFPPGEATDVATFDSLLGQPPDEQQQIDALTNHINDNSGGLAPFFWLSPDQMDPQQKRVYDQWAAAPYNTQIGLYSDQGQTWDPNGKESLADFAKRNGVEVPAADNQNSALQGLLDAGAPGVQGLKRGISGQGGTAESSGFEGMTDQPWYKAFTEQFGMTPDEAYATDPYNQDTGTGSWDAIDLFRRQFGANGQAPAEPAGQPETQPGYIEAGYRYTGGGAGDPKNWFNPVTGMTQAQEMATVTTSDGLKTGKQVFDYITGKGIDAATVAAASPQQRTAEYNRLVAADKSKKSNADSAAARQQYTNALVSSNQQKRQDQLDQAAKENARAERKQKLDIITELLRQATGAGGPRNLHLALSLLMALDNITPQEKAIISAAAGPRLARAVGAAA